MWISVFAVTIAISIGCVVTAIVIEDLASLGRMSVRSSARFLSPSAWSSKRFARRRFFHLLARNRKQHFTLPGNPLSALLRGCGRSTTSYWGFFAVLTLH